MKKESESRNPSDDPPPWTGPLLDVAIGAEDLWDFIHFGRCNPDWGGPPTVPELALLMFACGCDMLRGTDPPDPVTNVVNAIHAQLPELERLIQQYCDSSTEEQSKAEQDGD